tara:strand:- start:606 stop:2201 length:1596 start_codon:yes stop_codon:yes gene_type:complete
MKSEVNIVKTLPFLNQKAGTSGLRKSVNDFKKKNFLENYIQSIINSNLFSSSEIIIGSDGRYFSKEAIEITLKICIANNIKKIILGEKGILSTPALSYLIKFNKSDGGINFSASHNPGGKDGDFGIKINSSNGGPIVQRWIEKIFKETLNISSFKTVDLKKKININQKNIFKINNTLIEIIDPVDDYVNFLQNIFDFSLIKSLFKSNFKFTFNAMNGVTGPYAKKIFCDIFELDEKHIINSFPKQDFGGLIPDPCFENAKDFYKLFNDNSRYDMGALSDGDGDRNIILAKNFELSSSDSLAIIVQYSHKILNLKQPLNGVARSFPTSKALDKVAQKRNLKVFETPTGWKFFSNLLDNGLVTICGEESAGLGSDHIREKDGLWAILFWLSIIAITKNSVKQIVENHWIEYGRFFSKRYDYNILTKKKLRHIFKIMKNYSINNQELKVMGIKKIIDFEYFDPIEKVYYKDQGKVIFFNDKNLRLSVRQSGTNSKKYLLRIYVEYYSKNYNNESFINKKMDSVLSDFVKIFMIT